VAAAPLFLLGAATPAEAKHCKCKPGHQAGAAHKQKPKAYAQKRHAKRTYHAKSHHGDGLNTYGWQRQTGYGHSYGPGYGYVGEPNREGPYVRQYSSVDVQSSHYDSGWRDTYSGAPVPPPHGPGVIGHSHHYDSGWMSRGGAGACGHPGAVMCLPAGHPPMAYGHGGHHGHTVQHHGSHHGHSTYPRHGAHHDHSYHHGYGAHEVKVQPEVFYGGLAGGVSGPESYGGFPTGGGAVILGPSAGGSTYATARADAYAAASASARSKAYRGYGYKKPRH
jgi:hypothetical protein